MKMPALSVRQPWASLIVWGLKRVEIRSWRTEFQGRLLIHAAKTPDENAIRRFGLGDLPFGALIGWVSLTGVEPFTPARWTALAEGHLDAGQYQPGLFAWHLENPSTLLQPIPYRGDRGLFQVDVESAGLDPRIAGESGAGASGRHSS